MREVQWERMFPDELEAAASACSLVYMPYGLCEPHGPQSALGMDALRAHGYCVRAARLSGGIVAPPFWWNVHEMGIYAAWAARMVGEARPWLTALPPAMFFKSAWYHIRAVDALDLRAAVLVTGHAGPHAHDLPAFTALAQPHVAVRLDFLACGEVTDAPLAHAGKEETSLLWALEPECIDVSRMPAEGLPEPRFAMGADAQGADRRYGEKLVADIAAALADRAARLLSSYHEPESARRPLTFGEAERIWVEHIEPGLAGFECMQVPPEGPGESSRWHRHWRG